MTYACEHDGWLPEAFSGPDWAWGGQCKIWCDDLAAYDATAASGILNCPSEQQPHMLADIKYGMYTESYNNGPVAYGYNMHYAKNYWFSGWEHSYHPQRLSQLNKPSKGLVVADINVKLGGNKLFFEPGYNALRHEGNWNSLMADSSVQTWDDIPAALQNDNGDFFRWTDLPGNPR